MEIRLRRMKGGMKNRLEKKREDNFIVRKKYMKCWIYLIPIVVEIVDKK